MKTIYIDKDFKCHTSNDGTMIEVQTEFFENRCDAFIEGYRFVPVGETWIREDGEIFIGEMAAPWRPDYELEIIQQAYELAAEKEEELNAAYAAGVSSI